MRVSIKPFAIALLVVVLVFGVFPVTGLASEPVPSVPLVDLDRNLDSAVESGEFSLGVRGRADRDATRPDGPTEPNTDVVALDWKLDEARVASAMNSQSKQKSKWSDLSTTTKAWFIVGAVLIVGITAAALSD
jgi:hypothetical protein